MEGKGKGKRKQENYHREERREKERGNKEINIKGKGGVKERGNEKRRNVRRKLVEPLLKAWAKADNALFPISQCLDFNLCFQNSCRHPPPFSPSAFRHRPSFVIIRLSPPPSLPSTFLHFSLIALSSSFAFRHVPPFFTSFVFLNHCLYHPSLITIRSYSRIIYLF